MHILSCQPRTVFKRGKIEIEYLDKYRCLHLNWAGDITSELYISIMTEMLQFSKKLNIEYWLLDARDGENLELFDKKWAKQFFTKELPQHPIKKIARIASGDFHFETNLSSLISEILNGTKVTYRFKYLPDADHALKWFVDEDN